MSESDNQDSTSRGIGTDEWVAQHEARIAQPTTTMGKLADRWALLPVPAQWALPLIVVLLIPFTTTSDYVLRIGVNLGLFIMLVIGLNLTVGYAGLLDLGFVAFYGFGAYFYAFVSSPQFGISWPSWIALPFVVAVTAIIGLALGTPSRRLSGDYLAIATLFFGQMFLVLAISSDAVQFPWMDEPIDITGGPNGIPNVDQISFLGFEFTSTLSYYFLLLGIVMLGIIATRRIHNSRQGLAWRSMGEDELAAQHMTVPVVRMKLLAFSVGAAVAGLAGAFFASVQMGVYPSTFKLPLLIMLYAALILGGLGSVPGLLIGAVVMVVLPEILRFPDYSNYLFLVTLIIGSIVLIKSWKLIVAIFAATIAVGFVANAIFLAAGVPYLPIDEWIEGPLAPVLGTWIFMPEERLVFGNIAFVLLIVVIAWMTTRSHRVRLIAFPFVLWLTVFTWEVRLLLEPSVTRQLLIGALLVVLMAARPQGLFGKPRVEVL
jgi:ABC-type branched-subunit amino acid transport system permease subunit